MKTESFAARVVHTGSTVDVVFQVPHDVIDNLDPRMRNILQKATEGIAGTVGQFLSAVLVSSCLAAPKSAEALIESVEALEDECAHIGELGRSALRKDPDA